MATRVLDTSTEAQIPTTHRGRAPVHVANALRDAIASGAMPAGVQLRQEDLATRFGVSRVPVREALKILAGEGIVVHRPRRGFFVAELSSDEMRQLYTARRLLETEVLKSLQWPSAETIADLRRQLAKLAKAAKARDVARWSKLHREYHRAIFELSPDAVLVGEVMRLWALTDRYRSLLAHQYLDEGAVAGEEEVLDLLVAHDRKGLLANFKADRHRIEQELRRLLEAREL
ncbi:MAG: GntR family transcriptional regulator [Acidimicrobiia bacterium]|nr:GntR family transcriptional regulator [Acidimicrobiia bacterium]